MTVTLRRAKSSDARFVFSLRNEKGVRQASFRSSLIPWAEHEVWYRRTLKHPDAVLYIVLAQGRPAGTVRADRKTRANGEVHIALWPEWRGRGVAAQALQRLITRVTQGHWKLKTLVARVKPENRASLSLFEHLGFERARSTAAEVRLEWTRKKGGKALVIVDAGTRAGMGHLTRQAALTRELMRRGTRCRVWLRCGKKDLRVAAKFFEKGIGLYAHAQKPPDERGFTMGVIDTLKLPLKTQLRPFLEARTPLALVGNYRQAPSWAGACFNPYSRTLAASLRCKIFSSTRYTILSREFSTPGKKNSIRKEGQNLFVFAGGGNTEGMLLKILDAVKKLPARYRVVLVVGHYFTLERQLRARLRALGPRLRVLRNLSPAAMRRCMGRCDLALLSFGRSLDEARCLGLPSLLLTNSPLNASGASCAARQGGTRYLGDFRKISHEALTRRVTTLLKDTAGRRRMAARGQSLIDGRGASRTAAALEAWAAKQKRPS